MTNYSSYESFLESFLRTASDREKDALCAFRGMDKLTGAEFLEREDDIRAGAAIHARINAGYAGMTEAELDDLLADVAAEIDRATDAAREECDVCECIYCGCEVTREGHVPASDDDDAWAQIRRESGHADDCEWVQTRAHRVDS